MVGIAANLFLAAFKAVAGWVAGSVAIIMDAVNNLSDALSSVITIVGTKLSEKPADREHPFGYGRVEYFSAIIISVIVLSTGILSLVESVKKIFNPTHPSYTATEPGSHFLGQSGGHHRGHRGEARPRLVCEETGKAVAEQRFGGQWR